MYIKQNLKAQEGHQYLFSANIIKKHVKK